MKPIVRYSAAGAVLVIVTSAFVAWAIFEANRQRSDVEATLLGEAALLARALAPGLSAASDAAREIDEAVSWRLLDNARLLGELQASERPSPERLRELAESSGLDSAVTFDRGGRLTMLAGDDPPESLREEVVQMLAGDTEELILGSSLDGDARHVGAAVRTRDGGAVLVTVHAVSARAFARRLGPENLLHTVIESGSVLYLEYREEPDGALSSASWDGGDIPPVASSATHLRDIRGRLAFDVVVPASAPAGLEGTLRVGFDGSPVREASSIAARRTLLVSLVLAGFALAIAGFALVSRLRSTERAEAEVLLARAEQARRQSERLAAAGALTAGLAHEVRSPLNAIALAAQRLERTLPRDSEVHSFAGRIRGEVARLEGVLREFLELARPVSGERADIDLARVASDVLDLLSEEAGGRGVTLDPVRGTAVALGDAEALRRALINLVRNAVQACEAGAHVGVETGVEGDSAFLRVVDEGSGIAPEDEERILEPFVTTRTGGTGLGLAIVRRIAEDHGGTLNLRNRPRRGAHAELRIPAAQER